MTGRRLVRSVMAQTALEIRLTIQRGESLLVTVVIPSALLIFFASAGILPAGQRRIEVLLAATLALAVISTGLVSLSIATAYERYYGVLKRLGATPLPRAGLVAAKILAVLTIETAQCALLAGIAAIFFGWRPASSFLFVIPLVIAGTTAFAGIGMAMAGTLRAELTLAASNGLFLFFLLLGGLYVRLDHLPAGLGAVAGALPSAALADALRAALRASPMPLSSVLILLAWAVLTPLVAARLFRWE